MDPKVKKAEQRVRVSHLLGIDSPMVIWHTDLETLGLTGGGTSSAGGGTSSTGGGDSSSGSGPTPPESVQYVATCDAVNHEPAADVYEGRWYGGLVQTLDEAVALARQHLDGWAYVAMYVDGVQIGPVIHP